MTLTKAEIADTFHERYPEVSKQKALRMTSALVDLCGSVAQSDDIESVRIFRLGLFYAADKRARIGRNPTTNEPAPICARRILKFKKSQILMGAVECQKQ
ncbi:MULTISPECIES: HU family DNA-binding protein [Shewanella]|uniref:HU family DNA-binding protein n=1 Tax=Shewanella TaxID=22 RepID=UPI001AAF9B10|nr:HU family DNA-binding protein [Shewanella algae]MBO2580262.1 HU family DNA-binding protein [Shewanella algae]HDS1207848.1 HU family DNA-binding protein [Shewanella algae]